MFSKLTTLAVLCAVGMAAALDDVAEWKQFKMTYGKTYSAEDEAKRFEIFKGNSIIAAKLTAQSGGDAEFGVTKYSDLSKDEFKARYLTYKPSNHTSEAVEMDVSEITTTVGSNPIKWDWFGNLTTAVKDQGQCGSCWAFSATEQMESMAIKAGVIKGNEPLAVQQIVSCDHDQDEGCNGGDTPTAYAYIKKANGLEKESEFPYFSGANGRTGWCLGRDAKAKTADLTGFSYVGKKQETVMQKYIQSTAPLSICVDASSWQTYKKGVVGPATCGKQLDHCVQVTGYDLSMTKFSKKAWLVRNSWNTDWGMKGFIAVEYDVDACGISTEPTTVAIKV